MLAHYQYQPQTSTPNSDPISSTQGPYPPMTGVRTLIRSPCLRILPPSVQISSLTTMRRYFSACSHSIAVRDFSIEGILAASKGRRSRTLISSPARSMENELRPEAREKGPYSRISSLMTPFNGSERNGGRPRHPPYPGQRASPRWECRWFCPSPWPRSTHLAFPLNLENIVLWQVRP